MSNNMYLCWRIEGDALCIELCEQGGQEPALLSSIKIPREVLVPGAWGGARAFTTEEPNDG